MPATFNDAGLYGLTPLRPGNSKVMGAVTTSSSGNAIRCVVGTVQVAARDFSGPGADWMGRSVLGIRYRPVRWDWQIVCASDANLNTVEAAIDAYLADSRECVIVDSAGRQSSFGVMVLPGTMRMGYRERLSDGRMLQRWSVQFHVLRPSLSPGSL